MTQATTTAAIGSQRRPDCSTLSALRSIVSDFSNSLLSRVIVHFHPAAHCSILRGSIVRAGILARGRLACLAMEWAGAHVPWRAAPTFRCQICSNPRGTPGGSRIEDVSSQYLKPNSDGGKSCNQQACAPDLTFVDRNIVDLFCGQTLSRLRHIRLKMTQAPRPGSHCASGRPRRPMPGSFNAGRRMSRPTTPPKRLSSIPSIHPIVSPR